MKDSLPSIREIAKAAGVSASTVSRALNSDVPVSPATRRKINDAIASLQSGTQRKSSATNRRVGLIISEVFGNNLGAHPSIFAIVSSFTNCLDEQGISHSKLLYRSDTEDIQKLLEQPMDGYLVIGTSETVDRVILEALQKKTAPFLIINRDIESTRISSVNIDDEYASEMAVSHLVELGHKSIAFVGGDRDFQNTQRRYKGYLAAMNKAGIPLREELVFFGEYSELSGYRQGQKLLALRQRPTAAYFTSDTIAIGCMNYLTGHGVRIPRDLAVIGFGNIDASQYTAPPLSTVCQPDEEMGSIAAKALVQLMECPRIAFQHVLVKTELVLRESSGGPLRK